MHAIIEPQTAENPLLSFLFDTDSYKSSHFLQYPQGMTRMMSYIEARGGAHPRVVFFGLQYCLAKYLQARVTHATVDEAVELMAAHGVAFPEAGWRHVVDAHDGRLPVRIRAVREGTVVPTGNVLLTIESTDAKVPWVVGWVETMLLRIWYPITVATRSWHLKSHLLDALRQTADGRVDESVLFKLHDFGSRGASCQEQAAIGGLAHLVNFRGSDTLVALHYARRFYGEAMAGFSINAAEHSTITSWGRAHEVDAYRNMVRQFGKPGAVFAVVSDSYDLFRAVDELWGEALRAEVVASGATLVVRPDSGEPTEIVPRLLAHLGAKFGYDVNAKGYKVLRHVRAIQGDGVDVESLPRILAAVTGAGWSADNLAFGMGAGLLQKCDRDTLKMAMKMCHATIDGRSVPVFKDPATDHGKRSKAGRLDLVLGASGYTTVTLDDGVERHPESQLVDVFENGTMLETTTLAEVRKRADAARG
jgi:nicotinamide phosphoribosyltransferase